jgi:hypothetical protein
MVPNPRRGLHNSASLAWSSIEGPNSAIIARAVQFWSTVTGGAPFPSASIFSDITPDCSNKRHSCLVFHELSPFGGGSDTASLSYGFLCKITEKDAFLRHVRTLSLACSRRSDDGLGPDHLNLDYLPDLKQLVLIEAKRGPWVYELDDEDLISTLEDWILGCARTGRPLERIDFHRYHERARALSNRLQQAQAATAINWAEDVQLPQVAVPY